MRTAIDVTLAKPSPTARQLTDMAVRVWRLIDRAETMIEALLTLAISDQGKLSTEFTDLATWAEDAIDAAAPEIKRLDLPVDAELDPAETTGDPQPLERMISTLVDNAVRHNEPGGWIRLRTGASDAAVYLEIANSGPFIPDDAVPGQAPGTASGSACLSPGQSSPRTTRPSPSAASPPAAWTSR